MILFSLSRDGGGGWKSIESTMLPMIFYLNSIDVYMYCIESTCIGVSGGIVSCATVNQ